MLPTASGTDLFSGGLHAHLTITYKGKSIEEVVDLDWADHELHEFKFDDDCRQEITIHATACDEPAVGAEVAVTMDSKEHPEVIRTTTNSDGECVFSVPNDKEYGVTVLVSYKGQEEDVSFFTDYSGSKTFDFQFDKGCDDQIPEVCAIATTHCNLFNEEYGTQYLTWDNYGKRWRFDQHLDDPSIYVDIYDNLKNLNYHLESESAVNVKPENWPAGPIYTHPEWGDYSNIMLSQWGSAFFTIEAAFPGGIYYEHSLLSGYTQRSKTETVLGKECNVWENKSTGSVIWEWKKVILRREVNGKVTFEIAKITENVPVTAFTNQSAVPSWIE